MGKPTTCARKEALYDACINIKVSVTLCRVPSRALIGQSARPRYCRLSARHFLTGKRENAGTTATKTEHETAGHVASHRKDGNFREPLSDKTLKTTLGCTEAQPTSDVHAGPYLPHFSQTRCMRYAGQYAHKFTLNLQ